MTTAPSALHPLSALDWIVVAAYGAVVLWIGWAANRKQKSPEDYFLGGRRLSFWLVGISLIATSFSSVSLIGGTSFGFRTGMRWWQLQLGDLAALIVVCALFLPFFSRLRLTTAYEYLEHRFGVVARTAGSALFIAQTLFRAAILVYAPALAVATVLDWPIEAAIVVAGAAALLYSACGGLGAVVWTDLIQFSVIVFAVGWCIFLVAGDVPGGFGTIFSHGARTGRLEAVTVTPDFRSPFNLMGALVPYGVLALSLFGTNQQAVQRFLSCPDRRAARRAAFVNWVAGSVALGITLFLGVCLASWADLSPAGTGFAPAANQELPRFLVSRLPAGMAGLMLAAIFAASMSSMDSAIHSLSTATIVDFVRRFARRPPSPRTELLMARIATGVFGLLAVAGALYAAGTDESLLDTLVRWLGYFAGPLLGLFLLGMLTRKVGETPAVLGVGLAFGLVVAAVLLGLPRILGVHPLWLAPASCAVTVLVGLGAALVIPR